LNSAQQKIVSAEKVSCISDSKKIKREHSLVFRKETTPENEHEKNK